MDGNVLRALTLAVETLRARAGALGGLDEPKLALGLRHVGKSNSLVVDLQQAGDVHSAGTGHAVAALRAWDGPKLFVRRRHPAYEGHFVR